MILLNLTGDGEKIITENLGLMQNKRLNGINHALNKKQNSSH